MPRLALAVAVAILLSGCGSEEPSASATSGGATSAAGAGPTTGAGAATAATSAAGAGGATGSGTGATTGSGGAGGGQPANNGFPDAWIDGTDCSEPEVMVWEYDADTFILRQSLCTHFEGNFVYLLFGEDRVLLQDTGTGDADIAGAVYGVISEWLVAKGKASIDLVVTHSHGHGDHVGGDGQFSGQPDTLVVGPSVASVESFFGIGQWPSQVVQYDLGGRVLDVIPIPGHQNAHVALYDRRDDLLLTGDTLYPGRLYISSWSSYQASIQRLVDFVEAGNPVTWVLGTHIEMKAAGGDYAFGASQHPGEHALQLDYPILLELNQAVIAMGGTPSYEEHADFIIYP